MPHYYSPATGEHIRTADPAPWMGGTDIAPPAYDPATASAIWRGNEIGWEIAAAVPPEDPVPAAVSRFQARAALHQAGLLEAAEAAVATSDMIVRLAWQDAQEFRRDSPTVAALADALGLTPAQLDELFRQAAGIVA